MKEGDYCWSLPSWLSKRDRSIAVVALLRRMATAVNEDECDWHFQARSLLLRMYCRNSSVVMERSMLN